MVWNQQVDELFKEVHIRRFNGERKFGSAQNFNCPSGEQCTDRLAPCASLNCESFTCRPAMLGKVIDPIG